MTCRHGCCTGSVVLNHPIRVNRKCQLLDNVEVFETKQDPRLQQSDYEEKMWNYSASMTIAIPCPPPIQAVATPYWPPLRFNSYARVRTKRVPVAANG